MLNIGRMAPGGHDYYIGIVADGAEDYYLARGEEPGWWLGRGAITLDLDGRVEAEQLRRVLAGDHPASGDRLAAHPARRVPGFDLTFRAPKSVSLLWGLGDRQASASVAAAHDAAVDAAVGYLERAAGYTRRGAGGTERLPVEGFVAAAFRHRTSRAGDPLLHTHVLVANLAETVDDRVWRTLDSKALFAHARTAGFLYQAHLRHELTRTLGVRWGPVINGCADLDAVPRTWIEAFSRRRAQIVATLQARGESSARAAQIATLDTRQAKEVQVSEAELRAAWRSRATAVGIDPSWTRQAIGVAQPRRPDLLGLYRELVHDEGLTAESSTFTRRDALRAVAERLPGGAPVERIEQLTDATLGHDPDQVIALGTDRGYLTAVDVIRREDGTAVPADTGEVRYTTRGLLLTEQHAIHHALARRDDRLATVDGPTVDAAIARRRLSDEQASMVRQLTRSGHGVDVVVGKAGTGKTYALDAARDAWTRAGLRVTGVAVAARAALELQDAAGILSTTLARLLAQLEDGLPGAPLAPGSVLVVDEAGMVGTRQLARLLAHAEAHKTKVVLVGDPHQLPELDAGGLFRALTTRLPAVELADNRRQAQPWEADALDQLRHGDLDQAVAAYREHGRVVTGVTADAVRDQLVADWWHSHDRTGPTNAVMVALRRADVDDLNHRARTRLAASGRLTGPALQVGDVGFQAGDRIVCLRNDRRLGVVNGTRVTITAVDPDRRLVQATDDDGRALLLPSGYLDAGHVTHGYAITGHKAQGLTVDHTFVLGSEALYREWGYVALSRGRHTNRLYVCATGPDDELDRHGHQPPGDPVVDVTARLSRSRAQQPVTADPAELAARWRQLHTRLHAPDTIRRQRLDQRRTELLEQRQRIVDQLDRIDARLGRYRDGIGRWRNRHDLARLEHDLQLRRRDLDRTDDTLAELDRESAGLPSRQDLARLQTAYAEATEALRQAAVGRVDGSRHRTPDYLTTTLGPAPDDPAGRQRWQRAALEVEQYRLRWHITDPDRPLGTEPTHPVQRDSHRQAARAIGRHQRDLDRQPTHERSRGLGMELSR